MGGCTTKLELVGYTLDMRTANSVYYSSLRIRKFQLQLLMVHNIGSCLFEHDCAIFIHNFDGPWYAFGIYFMGQGHDAKWISTDPCLFLSQVVPPPHQPQVFFLNKRKIFEKTDNVEKSQEDVHF